jgi:hypothetical protein
MPGPPHTSGNYNLCSVSASLPTLVFSIFLIAAIPVSMKCFPMVVLIYISLMPNDEDCLLGLLALSASSLEEYLFKSLGHFKNWTACLLLLSCHNI